MYLFYLIVLVDGTHFTFVWSWVGLTCYLPISRITSKIAMQILLVLSLEGIQ